MELEEQVRNDPHFLFKAVTGDETWILMGTILKPNSNRPSGSGHLTPAEESAASKKQREVNADLFRRCRGYP